MNVVRSEKEARALFDLLIEFDKVLGLDIDMAEKVENVKKELTTNKELIEKRKQARKEKLETCR